MLANGAFAQQDVGFQINAHYFSGKNIVKVKRDFFDPYLWVLTQNKEVYRINSISREIENLTSVFAAYGNYKFIDIAGFNKETVFIATNSTDLIQYKNGLIKIIGRNEGITTAINSIGVDKNSMDDYYHFIPPATKPRLMIGSDVVRYSYDIQAEKIKKEDYSLGSKVYEATYRTQLFKDSTNEVNDFGTKSRVPCWGVGKDYLYKCYLWQSDNEYTNSINTASMVSPSVYEYDGFSYYFDLFWGTKTGLFQINLNASFQDVRHRHYLEGITVNKIADIYGLTAFENGIWYRDNDMIKQNLLVGTDNGLYFSNSLYDGYSGDFIPMELFHADELGNIKVNDICVNAASVGPPICEDGVWVATVNGLYYLKPDYAQFITGGKVRAASFKNAPKNQDELNICAGSTATAKVSVPNNGGNSIQWYKNGQQLPGESGYELQINTAGEYYAALYDPCQNIHLETNHLKANIISAPKFSFDYPETLVICDAATTSLATDHSPDYKYRWLKDGVLTNDDSYTINVHSNGKYRVEVSACSGSWVSSKEVNVVFVNLPEARIMADKTSYCEGEAANLSLNIQPAPEYTISWLVDGQRDPSLDGKTNITRNSNARISVELKSVTGNCIKTSEPTEIAFVKSPVFGLNQTGKVYLCEGETLRVEADPNTTYQYRWYKNGVLTDKTGPLLAINEAGIYYAEASACDNSWVPSGSVEIKKILLGAPLIQPSRAAYCSGDIATLALKTTASNAYTISWERDGIPLPAYTNSDKIMTDVPGDYRAIMTSTEKNTCMAISPVYHLSYSPYPTAQISQTVKTSLCEGEAVELSVADIAGAKVIWSTGESALKITIRHSGNYSVKVTNASGCEAESHIDLQLLPKPLLSVRDTSVCTFTRSTITLRAPAGFSSYTWNGVPGAATLEVSQPQTVSLVVTDENGCSATQNIVVASDCPEVKMGNTFTPNGDGVNDTWTISGIANDNTVQINIYDRYGQEVFKSRGYYTPWDGRRHGKLLPQGVYYYLISSKKGTSKTSGWVEVIY